MYKYVIRRLLLLIPVLLGISLLVFAIMYVTPGDPAQLMLGENAPKAAVEALREKMGLNDPFIVQYFRFVGKAITGDFGRSYTTGREVFAEIFSRFPNTLVLAILGIIISVVIGIPIGIISATKQYSAVDSISMVLALLGVSMPVFWLGLMLILLFSVKLGLLPSGGFDGLKSVILPALTLGVGSAAIVTRMTRSSMLEVIRQDYIRTARAKGVSEKVVINKHALCFNSYYYRSRTTIWTLIRWSCINRICIFMARSWKNDGRCNSAKRFSNCISSRYFSSSSI
ncbi:glutathione ABC transporter, permease protein GsiC [Fusobacterium gonidiaformans 3-1-5R]|uniref:Glutathione ABC transporter, permease protein GsiC n=1 Tax=Fusobacterium gonidiaformans 3-1-5R TaxID=469605 RepID=E5BGX3_9FUSO|nr:glutathione ABC transporter, permease protein GsiC [Fusobacterium gonidiaformans 3-1-5R]